VKRTSTAGTAPATPEPANIRSSPPVPGLSRSNPINLPSDDEEDDKDYINAEDLEMDNAELGEDEDIAALLADATTVTRPIRDHAALPLSTARAPPAPAASTGPIAEAENNDDADLPDIDAAANLSMSGARGESLVRDTHAEPDPVDDPS